MEQLAYSANVEVEELLGEWHPLVDQLGSAECLSSLSHTADALQLPRVTTIQALELFLDSYQAHILIPFELPVILRAFRHASRNETRELVAFDHQLTGPDRTPSLARASQRAGQRQLRRLRPLRDHRLLQRYLRAVEHKQARGWHVIVYGITLSIYSLPILQGLAFYERQVLAGFVQTAARYLRLSHRECGQILSRHCSDLPRSSDTLVPIRQWMATSHR